MDYVLKTKKNDKTEVLNILEKKKIDIQAIINGDFKVIERDRSVVIKTSTIYSLNELSNFLISILPKGVQVPFWS